MKQPMPWYTVVVFVVLGLSFLYAVILSVLERIRDRRARNMRGRVYWKN